MVLVETGASHKFISKEAVDVVLLPIEETKHFIVEVGDGHKVRNKGVCRNVEL